MSKGLIDISQTLRARLPVWPGDTPFSVERTWALTEDCPVNVSRLTLSTHSGAHADAPLHYDQGGADIAAVALDAYIGPAQLIDVSAFGPRRITVADVADRLRPDCGRLILKTFATFPTDHWPTAFATPSLDPEDSKDLPAHHAVRRAGMAILEGLVLDAADEGRYEIIALPLKIEGADASPVRAVLRPLNP